MSFSIVMAYIHRPVEFSRTLDSYKKLYHKDDIEIVIVEDLSKEILHHGVCLNILKQSGLNYKHIVINRNTQKWRNPGILYNKAVELATCDNIHITNPENIHCGPILKHCVDYMTDDNYIVYACRPLKHIPDTVTNLSECINNFVDRSNHDGWNQHSKYNNRLLHFATVISKNLYLKIGGFDYRYENGICFEDNDFVETLLYNKIPILAFDEPFVMHQDHEKDISFFEYYEEGFQKNRQIYLDKWKKEPPIHREGW